jgi:hypothetical protein
MEHKLSGLTPTKEWNFATKLGKTRRDLNAGLGPRFRCQQAS